MKRFFVLGMIAFIILACSTTRETTKNSVSLVRNGQDTTEYEILFFDPGFEKWYQINFNIGKDHSNEYYRFKNNAAVNRWNNYFTSGVNRSVVESLIDYWPDIDYGIDVNRRLYWYFYYIETQYHIPLFM